MRRLAVAGVITLGVAIETNEINVMCHYVFTGHSGCGAGALKDFFQLIQAVKRCRHITQGVVVRLGIQPRFGISTSSLAYCLCQD